MGTSVIQGIGDEVLIYCGAFFALLVGAIIASRYFLPSETHIPEYFASAGGERRTYGSETCPICMETHRLAVETNCGHKFCGPCIQSYVQNDEHRGIFTGGSSCPMCRQKISLLLLSFSREESANEEERRQVEMAVYEYNVRHASGPRGWMTYIRDCPVLFRHLINDFFSMGGLMLVFRVRVITCLVVAVMYLLLPLDIVPEAVFGMFGLLDDVLVVFLCAIYLSIIYRRFLVANARNLNLSSDD